MKAWIKVIHQGKHLHLVYEDLIDDAVVQPLFHELYRTDATILCMCNPEHPVPMHLRRVRIRPPSYTVATNPYHEHALGCPRYHESSFHHTPYFTSRISKRDTPQFTTTHLVGQVEKAKGELFVPELDQLNDTQRVAATHKQGPCMVIAGAGSGKTAVSIARIKHLIDNGVAPRDILACTFTKKAALEFKTRLIDLVGKIGKEVTVGTIHSVAYRMLLPKFSKEWSVVSDPAWLIERVLEAPSAYNKHGLGPVMKASEATLAVYKAKADAKGPEQVEDPLGKIYFAYEALKAERKQVDFEDLLLLSVRKFQTEPEFAKHWSHRWQYVMVDEFQDTNFAQWLFLLELIRHTQNLFVVGDDWQSVYGFRGARPALMGDFLQQFPKAKKVFLTTNYRSHDLIVDLGNRVIELNRGHQIAKKVVAYHAMPDDAVTQVVEVKSDGEEAKFVADEIVTLHARNPHLPWNEFAVLYRINIQSRVYEEALTEREIPYQVIGDVHFYENREVKLILDYLRTTQDTSDPALWGYLLNHPKRFIPNAVVKEVQQGGWDAVLQHPKCHTFVKTIRQLERHTEPAKAIGWLVQSQKGLLREQDEDEPIKWLDSLVDSAARYTTISEFLRYVDWIVEQSKKPKKDAVQLLTIHRSKGLEYNTVFVVGLAEGLFPHKRSSTGEALREETRLCYVAITRAKKNLYLLAANRYGSKERELSRFVKALQQV